MGHKKTLKSRRPLTTELAGLDAQDRHGLRAAGIYTPERLYRAARSLEAPALVAAGVYTLRLERAFRHAELAIHKGMGCQAAPLLHKAGIDGVARLADADAEALYARINEMKFDARKPSRAEVRVWIQPADSNGDP